MGTNNDLNENTENGSSAGSAGESRPVRAGHNAGNYYKELYNDLPKEVVELLMKTHPLMGKTSDRRASLDSSHMGPEEEISTNDDSAPNIIDEEKLSEMVRERQRAMEERTSYIKSMDLDRIGKEASLDEVFGEDEYEEICRTPKSTGMALGGILTIAVLIVLAFFVYRTVALSGQLKKANASIEAGSELSEKYEELKLENLALAEEIRSLKGSGEETVPEETTAASTEPATAPVMSYNDYTVVAGDTFWGIAGKVYGDGSKFGLILEANGMTENSKLPIGTVLKIPNL